LSKREVVAKPKEKRRGGPDTQTQKRGRDGHLSGERSNQSKAPGFRTGNEGHLGWWGQIGCPKKQ